jgi:TPR repeat protein
MSKTFAKNTIKHPSIWEGLVRLPLLLLLLSFSVTLSAQNADKLYKEAKALYDAKDYTQAFPKLKTAAEKGHKKAQYRLGRCYEKGRGVTKDEIAAFRWYGKSAAQDYAKAQYAVGNCYKEGIGTAKDHKKAVEYFTKAAQNDNADAQYQLGKCYLKGKGITADAKKAASWFKKAVNNEKDGKDIIAKLRRKVAEGDEDAKTIMKLAGVKP